MKIMFFLGFNNPFPGAAWTRVHFFAKYFSTKGYLVDIVGTWSPRSSYKGYLRFNQVNCYDIIPSIDFNNFVLFFFKFISAFVVAVLILILRKPQIIIISMPPADVGLGSLFACKVLRKKTVIELRDEWEDYLISSAISKTGKSCYSTMKRLMYYIYNKSDAIVTVTHASLMNLVKRGIKNAKVITNGADINIFKPFKKNRDDKFFKIIYTGVVGGYYRLDIAIKAIKLLVKRELENIKLIIWGEADRSLINLACKLGVADKIEFRGMTNDKFKLAKSIAEAHIGLIPYDDNPLWKSAIPAKFYEYCSCGIPVVATVYDYSLLAEITKTYNIGVISPPLDEDKLANAIYWLYKNRSFREAAGKRARKLIEEKFDRNKIAEEYLNLIKVITHRQPSSECFREDDQVIKSKYVNRLSQNSEDRQFMLK